jgi:hypothetical protein
VGFLSFINCAISFTDETSHARGSVHVKCPNISLSTSEWQHAKTETSLFLSGNTMPTTDCAEPSR